MPDASSINSSDTAEPVSREISAADVPPFEASGL